jgi:hypothetical protein
MTILGYFVKLRESMLGNDSHIGIAAPKMDDAAASQQLMDEGAHAGHTNGTDARPLPQFAGKPSFIKESQSTRKGSRSPLPSPRTAVPPSSPFPFPPTQTQRDDNAVEVPDSQAGPATANASSPPRSSLVVPASVTKSRRTYQKSKQSRRFDAVRDIEPEQDLGNDGDTTVGAAETASPSHGPGKRKRTFAAATVRELIGDGGRDDDLNSSSPPSNSKLKRIMKLTPRRPVPTNIYDIPEDEQRITNGDGSASVTRKTRTKTKNTFAAQDGQNNSIKELENYWTDANDDAKKAHDDAPGADDDAIMREPETSDDEARPDHSFDSEFSITEQEKKNGGKRRKKRSTFSTRETLLARRASGNPLPIRRSIMQSADAMTAADIALDTVCELEHPPDLRRNGEFTQDEKELIRRAVRDYQQSKDLETPDLVYNIQWTRDDLDHGVGKQTSNLSPQQQEQVRGNDEFWQQMKSIPVKRTHRAVRDHVRARYHQYKSGGWAEEEDEQLRRLHALHPNKWKIISTSIGDRSMQDCQNRWRDYLQYDDNKRNTSTWTKDEEELLIRAVNTLAQRDEDHRAETGQPPLDKYTGKNIRWPQVSVEMGYTRSRLQAYTKWKKLQQRYEPPQIQVEYKPRKEEARSSGPASTKKGKRGRPRKSQVMAQDSGHETEDDTTARPGLDGSDQSPRIPDHPINDGDEESVARTDFAQESVQGHEGHTGQGGVEESVQEEEDDKNASGQEQDDAQDQQESKPQDDVNDTAQDQEDDGVSQTPEEEDIREEVEDIVLDEEDENAPEQEHDEIQDQEQDGVQSQDEDQPTSVTNTPSSTKHRNTKEAKAAPPTTSASSVDKMLWGDKFDLMMALSERRDDYEEQIEWEEVAKPLKYPWSIQALQSALHAMVQLLRDDGKEVDMDDLPAVVDDILEFIAQEHPDELEKYYDPYEEVVSENGVEMKEATPTTPPSTEKKKKKKKRKSHEVEQLGSSPEKRRKKKKKRHSKSLAATADTPRSKQTIPESDAASEPEFSGW